ncbi:hypothetical protein LCGC14_3125830 [marine sediment metagenome]|uniref:Uncharacterized protein n=1 Tax=marine sediment metagenome TaxID=412755 RepID=A0A0F8W117_9ZZZZ
MDVLYLIGVGIVSILVLYIVVPSLLYLYTYSVTHAFMSVVLQIYLNKLKSHVEKKKEE